MPAEREINWKLLEGPLSNYIGRGLDKNRGFIRNDRIISYVHKDEAVELGTFQAQLLPSSRGAFNTEI